MPHVGGSFAPPLTDALLARYRELIDELGAGKVKEALQALYACCLKWWDLPASDDTGRPHPVGRGVIVPLTEPLKKALWEHIPWTDQLDLYASWLDAIDPVREKELRDAAFHLLWHVKELDLDREPLTADML